MKTGQELASMAIWPVQLHVVKAFRCIELTQEKSVHVLDGRKSERNDNANLGLSEFGVFLAQDLEGLLRISSLPLLQRLHPFDAHSSLERSASMRTSCRPRGTYLFRRALIAFGYALPRRHLIHDLTQGIGEYEVEILVAD